MTTLGKYRHLMQSSTDAGHFVILAIDHRANLKTALEKAADQSIADEEFAEFKQQVVDYLLPKSSAVLTDPAYGIARGIASHAITGCHGLLAPLEVTDYDLHASQRQPAFIEGWSVEKIKRCGGTGVKLLLNYHPLAQDCPQKHEMVARIVEDCAHYDIPFFLEPIVYSPDPDKHLTNAEKTELVIESARVLSRMGIDVLKTEFPLDPKEEPDESKWESALQSLNEACVVPWALLSGGVSFGTFLQQAILACKAGASGVMVGRAVWNEAVTPDAAQREHFLRTAATDRMHQLAEVCAQFATDWRTRISPPATDFEWYLD